VKALTSVDELTYIRGLLFRGNLVGSGVLDRCHQFGCSVFTNWHVWKHLKAWSMKYFIYALIASASLGRAELVVSPLTNSSDPDQRVFQRTGSQFGMPFLFQNNGTTDVDILFQSRLWQTGGKLAAPLSGTLVLKTNIAAGESFFYPVPVSIPEADRPIPMKLVWKLAGDSKTNGAITILGLPDFPAERLRTFFGAGPIITIGSDQNVIDWLKSCGIDIQSAELEPEPSEIANNPPMIVFQEDDESSRNQQIKLIRKLAAQRERLIVVFHQNTGLETMIETSPRYHHFDSGGIVLVLPARWRTDLSVDLATQYKFLELIEGAKDLSQDTVQEKQNDWRVEAK